MLKSSVAQPFGHGRLLNAAALVAGSTYISFVLSFVGNALIARFIGPADFGRYSYLVWLCGLLISLANNGLPTTGTRFISETLGRGSHDVANRVHGRLGRLQCWSLVATLTVFAAVLPLVQPSGWNNHLLWFGLIVICAVIPKARYLFEVSIAKGYGAFDVEARTTVIVALAATSITAVLCYADAGLDSFLVMFALASVAHMLLASRYLRQRTEPPSIDALAPDVAQAMHRHLFWTVVLAVAAAFSARSVETFMLNNLVGSREVGFFAIALGLSRAGSELICAGPNAVLMPAMAHAFGQDGIKRVGNIVFASLRHFTLLGLLLAGGGAFCAQAAITVMYGSQYHPAIDVFRVLVVVAGLTLPMGVLGSLLSTADHQKLRAAVSLLSLVLSTIAAVALIPRLGLAGAMFSSALSGLLVYIAVLLACMSTLSIRVPVSAILRQFLAAALAGGLCLSGVHWIDPTGATAQAVAGVLFMPLTLGLTMMLGAWPLVDIDMLRGLVARSDAVSRWLLPTIDRWRDRALARAG